MSFDRVLMKSELMRDEGLRLVVYRCTAGKLSIGVGRNLDDVGILPSETAALGITTASVTKNGVTVAQAMALLDFDIARVEKQLDAKLPWWRNLDDNRQRVLVNMTFNLGITRFLNFKNTIEFVRKGKYALASENMKKSLWHSQVGKRAVRLEALMHG